MKSVLRFTVALIWASLFIVVLGTLAAGFMYWLGTLLPGHRIAAVICGVAFVFLSIAVFVDWSNERNRNG